MEEKYRIEVENMDDHILCEHTDNFPDMEKKYEKLKIEYPKEIITVSKVLIEKTRHSELKHKL